MATIVWKFISLYFGQVAWLEGKIFLSYGRCLGSVLDTKCSNSKNSSKYGGLDYFFFSPWDF